MRDMLSKQEKKSVFLPLKTLLSDFLHVFDIITDLTLAKKMYIFSREEIQEIGSNFVYDYNKCFVWISLTTFGPYLIMYAS